MTFALSRSISDIRDGFAHHALWRCLAHQNIRHQYARSFFGPFWITLTTGVWVAAMSAVFGGLFGAPLKEVTPHITIGIVLWMFLSSIMNDGANALVQNRGYMLQFRTPVATFVWLIFYRNLIILAHNAVIVPIALIIFRTPPTAEIGLLLIGLPIWAMFCFGSALLLAVMTPRFRDIGPLVGMVMQVGFFFTPVVWRETDLRANQFVVDLNPFAHLIAVVRDPLLGSAPSLTDWLVSAGSAAGVVVLGVALLAFTGRRVMYWV